jgi:spore germination protein PF
MFYMPSIIGSVKIANVTDGAVNFGDTLNIAPKSVAKSSGGSGSFITGIFNVANNGFNATNTIDPDVVDQPTNQTN